MGNTVHNNKHSINIELILNANPLIQDSPILNPFQQSIQEEDEYDNQGEDHNDRTTPITPEQAKQFPFNCVGVLFNKQIKSYGTGILIAPNLVFTAAHNLREFDQSTPKNQINYTDFIFYPGLSGVATKRHLINDGFMQRNASAVSDRVFGIDVKSIRIPSEFTSPNSMEHDYALLLLSQPVSRKQYFPLGFNYYFLRETITNIGYRKDDAKLQKELGVQKMQESHGQHKIKNRYTLEHKITTTGGNSGGPIFIKRQVGPIAIAIHKGKKKDTAINCARLISQDLLVRVLDWEREFYWEEFQSKIKLFKMDASPSCQLVQGGCFLKRMEGGLTREGLRKSLKDRQSELKGELDSYNRQCDSLRLSIKELVKGFDKIRQVKQSLEFQLKAEELNYNNMAEQVQRLRGEIETFRRKKVAMDIERLSKLADIKSLGIKLEDKTEITRGSRLKTLSPQPIQRKESKSPLKYTQSIRTLSLIGFWDIKGPYADRFILKDRKAVLRNDDCQRYTISTLRHIQGYSTTSFKLRCYGGKRSIGMGVITADRKFYRFSGGKGMEGTLAFWTGQGKGKVDIQGWQDSWQNDMFLEQGQILIMEIDRYNMTVTFTVRSSHKQFQFPLSSTFKDKELYPFVSLASRGDAVEILL